MFLARFKTRRSRHESCRELDVFRLGVRRERPQGLYPQQRNPDMLLPHPYKAPIAREKPSWSFEQAHEPAVGMGAYGSRAQMLFHNG